LILVSCAEDDSVRITVNVDPPGSGYVEGGEGGLQKGEWVRLRAVSSEGFQFSRWSGDLLSDQKDLFFEATQSMQLTAHMGPLIHSEQIFDGYSEANKATSWFMTNRSFDRLFDVNSSYWGFEQTPTGLIPFVQGTWSSSKSYYFHDQGGYLYTDLNGDGARDLWAYYLKTPWPTNARGLHLFVEHESAPESLDLRFGLTQVRKAVLAELDGDGTPEVVLFSSGVDAAPFPGDSMAVFHPEERRYDYLSDDIGYWHGGAAGDVDGDGWMDIVAYCGGGRNPVHPTVYINRQGSGFTLGNHLFRNFTHEDNYYTVELFDMDGDSRPDLFLGARDRLIMIPNQHGVYDRGSAVPVPLPIGYEVMDIAFLDVDLDGQEDLVTMSNVDGYNGYGLSIFLKEESGGFSDATDRFATGTEGKGANTWIKWIRLFDAEHDGDIDLVGDGLFGDLSNPNRYQMVFWRNDSGVFRRAF
jgi:hypothetical protein